MADKINEINSDLSEILKDTINGKSIAQLIAEKDFYLETQLLRDYKLISDRIKQALNQMTEENFMLKSVEIEAILLVVVEQFRERKNNAQHTLSEMHNKI